MSAPVSRTVPRLWSQHTDGHAIAARKVPVADMVIDQGDAEMQLDIGAVEARMYCAESTGLSEIAGQGPAPWAPELAPTAPDLRQHRWRKRPDA